MRSPFVGAILIVLGLVLIIAAVRGRAPQVVALYRK
jgi:hypothetical protein